MQKITAFLEQYVEWVALAIGALFLLMMVFLYVLQTPVSDKVGNRTVTLATVENEINSQSTSELEAKMSDPRVPTEDVLPYGKMFADHMSLKGQTLPQMRAGGWGANGAPDKPLVGPEKTPAPAAQMIATVLPVLPTPQWYGMSAGRSTVLTDPSTAPRVVIPVRQQNPVAGGPNAGGGPGGGGGGRGDTGGFAARMQAASDAMEARMAAKMAAMENGGRGGAGAGSTPPPALAGRQGGAPAAATPNTPAQPEVEGVDKVWVTAAWEIGTDELARAFTAANIPATLNTEFLRLETTREEFLPDGTWGHTTVIKPLAYHSVPEMPAAGAGSAQERTYDAWAAANAQTLLVPSFYARTAGDEWYVPGQPNPNEPVKQVAAPVAPVAPVRPGMPGGRNMRGGPGAGAQGAGGMGAGGMGAGGMGGGRRGGGAGGRRGGGAMYAPQSYAPENQDRAANISYQFGVPDDDVRGPGGPNAGRRQGLGGPGGPGGPGGAGMFGGGANMAAPAGMADAIPEGYTVPRGAFGPADLTQNILVWIHDDTVQPGKTYRYKMRYCIKNPFYGQSNVKDAEVAKRFALYSKESEWSDDVLVPSILRFFVATGITPNATMARFDVYRWQKGQWSKKGFAVDPGDMIGGKDGNVDYSTGYCLVDVKPDAISRQPVTISDAAGRLEGRNFQEDQSDASGFTKGIQWVDPNAVPPAGAAGANIGGPGGAGGPGAAGAGRVGAPGARGQGNPAGPARGGPRDFD